MDRGSGSPPAICNFVPIILLNPSDIHKTFYTDPLRIMPGGIEEYAGIQVSDER